MGGGKGWMGAPFGSVGGWLSGSFEVLSLRFELLSGVMAAGRHPRKFLGCLPAVDSLLHVQYVHTAVADRGHNCAN